MNKGEFQQKVLEIANVIHQNYPPKLKGDTEIMEFANAIRDLLEKDAAENNMPEGWQLVPKDADENQLYKGGEATNTYVEWGDNTELPYELAKEMYRAMLAAAPEYKEDK